MASNMPSQCDEQPREQWVEAFAIEEWPADGSDILCATPVMLDETIVTTSRDLAVEFCRRRGLDVPTRAEMWRVLHTSIDMPEWGAWDLAGRPCAYSDGQSCAWPTQSRVVLVLQLSLPRFGEWVRVPRCPGREDAPGYFESTGGNPAIDLYEDALVAEGEPRPTNRTSSDLVVFDVTHPDEPVDAKQAMIRCVRRFDKDRAP